MHLLSGRESPFNTPVVFIADSYACEGIDITQIILYIRVSLVPVLVRFSARNSVNHGQVLTNNYSGLCTPTDPPDLLRFPD